MNSESPVEWRVSQGLTEYPDALATMERRVADIIAGGPEQIWLVEHPPLYTAGTSARPDDLLDGNRFPVFTAGRGGEYTYHGPGQRVCYAMIDLDRRGRDIRRYVRDLEEWIIATLKHFDVTGERRSGRVGIWVDRSTDGDTIVREDKIAAIGVRVRRWVSFHGISINLEPSLNHYEGIVPCGISEFGVTSLEDLGVTASMADLDNALRSSFETVFRRETAIRSEGS
ncbi:MAG: lipoyl(octanoyl) transferase LipB [Alphaproteobacteria bacterium]|nr:lipoyl(octanoyl) transferase LipB [Alphaproteobacteria bacterium]